MLKMDHHVRLIKITIVVIFVLLIYLSMIGVFSSKQVDMTSPRGVIQGAYIYFGWVGETTTKLFDIGKDTVKLIGNAIKINDSNQDK